MGKGIASKQVLEKPATISTDATFNDTIKVQTKSIRHAEVWGRMSNFSAGQLDSVELLISPIDLDDEPADTDFVGAGAVTVNIGADGMFFVQALSRANGDQLGKLVKAEYITSGGADFTLELFLVITP